MSFKEFFNEKKQSTSKKSDKSWVKWSILSINLIVATLIILIVSLNVFWIVGFVQLKDRIQITNPEFYLNSEGIGFNASLYIDNDYKYASNINDISVKFTIANSSGYDLIFGEVPAFDIKRGEVSNVSLNMIFSYSMSFEELNNTVGTKPLWALLDISLRYGFYTITFRMSMTIEGGSVYE